MRSFRRILFVADVNIGDAIMLQQGVKVVRSYFPKARIDYLCNKSGGSLVFGIPEADHVYPVYEGSGLPSKEDLTHAGEIIKEGSYSVIFNLCPFIGKGDLQKGSQVIQLYLPFTSYLIRSLNLRAVSVHISYAIFLFLRELLAPLGEEKHMGRSSRGPTLDSYLFEGSSIYLAPEAMDQAEEFLRKHHLLGAKRLLFFNPDAASPYALMPLELQIQVLQQVLGGEDVHAVLLGSGHCHRGIEQRIMARLPKTFLDRVVVVPEVALSVYAALIDACDVFVSSDTGPVHISASWKVTLSERHAPRNRTAVLTIFGASNSRLYGYDSEDPLHLPANQKAPSKAFSAPAPCRNITCVNKLGKSCKKVRCFHGLRAEEISGYVLSYLGKLRREEHSEAARH